MDQRSDIPITKLIIVIKSLLTHTM